METAVLAAAGLAHDRSFMVVDEGGVFRSQRRDRVLATVLPRVSGDGQVLTLSAQALAPLRVEIRRDGPPRDVLLFGEPFCGIDQGDDAADWFSAAVGKRSRLVRVPPDHARVTTGEVAGTSGYADSCAVLVTSESSLADLNSRIAAGGSDPLPMNRFRPNIVVADWPQPYTEDAARVIDIGAARLVFGKIAIRCAVTTVDQVTGEKSRFEPLRTLATYRRFADGVGFGAKFVVERVGTLSVGDAVTAAQWA